MEVRTCQGKSQLRKVLRGGITFLCGKHNSDVSFFFFRNTVFLNTCSVQRCGIQCGVHIST